MKQYVDYTKFFKPIEKMKPFPWRKSQPVKCRDQIDYHGWYAKVQQS